MPGRQDARQRAIPGIAGAAGVAYKLADGTIDEIGAGEAYYIGPGHTPHIYAGTEVVESSPTAELAKTMEVVLRNSGGSA